MLIAALGFYAVACLGFLLPLSPLAYGGMRFVQGAAAGAAEVATLATVALVVPTSERGRASSRIYAAQLGGAAFGPLLGAFVGIRLMAYVFIFAASAASIAAVPVLRSTLGPRTQRNEPLPKLTIDARLVGAVCVAASLGLVIGAYESCWTLLMNFKGASSFELGISWTLFALPYVVCFRFGGWFADHTDRRMFATFGILNACAFCAIYPLLSVPALLALSCFEALGTSLALPSAQSILTEGADPRQMGRRQGVFTTAQTGAMAISAMVVVAYWMLDTAGVTSTRSRGAALHRRRSVTDREAAMGQNQAVTRRSGGTPGRAPPRRSSELIGAVAMNARSS